MGTDDRGRLELGTWLQGDAFAIEAVLGQGGAGITYRARQATPRRTVAVKEFYPQDFVARAGADVVPRGTSSPEEFARLKDLFRREADTLAALRHPSIVQVHQIFEEHGTVYMVMEFVEGQTLAATLDGAPAPGARALMGWVDPVCDALAAVHDGGVLHRDISPDNILIRPDGTPVLLDFGAAQSDSPERTRYSAISSVRDCFSPPEQYDEGAEHGPATDIYALAATLYFAASGRRPPVSTFRQTEIINHRPDPLTPLNAQGLRRIPAAFSDAVDAGLALARSDRPQSVEDFRAVLRAALDPADTATDTPARRTPPWWLWASVGGAAVVAAVLLVLEFGGGPGPGPVPEPTPIPTPVPTPVPAPTPAPTPMLEPTPVPGPRWTRRYTFGSPRADDRLAAATILPDGWIAFAGGTDGEARAGTDGWIVWFDPELRYAGDQTVGEGPAESFGSVAAMPDGGIVLAGTTSRGGGEASRGWLVRLGPDRNVIWDIALGEGTAAESIAAVDADADGGIVVAGRREDGERQTGWAVRLDAAGVIRWRYEFDARAYQDLRGVVALPDGRAMLAGWTEGAQGDPGTDSWVIGLRGHGRQEWSRNIGDDSDSSFNALAAHPAGGALAVGRRTVETAGGGTITPWAVRISADGTPGWERTYPSHVEGRVGELTSATALPDGGFVLTGRMLAPGFAPSQKPDLALIMRISAGGRELWRRTFRPDTHAYAIGDAVALPDGRIMLVGARENLDTGDIDGWAAILRGDGSDLHGGPDAVE